MTDLSTLTSWHADWSGLRVGVLGLGLTGFAVADTLVELGATVLVVTADATPQQAALVGVIGADLYQGDLSTPPQQLLDLDAEVLVVSPGFRPDHPLLLWAGAQGIPLWGDIELAWRVRDKVKAAEWLSVTGTTGVAETARLAEHIVAASGARVAAVGNNGIPVLHAVRDPMGFDVLIVELSSYQLHFTGTSVEGAISPLASACLNQGEDHLDWHGSSAAYASSLAKVYENTRVACVYNKADLATQEMVENAEVIEGCRAIGFDLGTPGPSDLGLVGDIVVDRAFHEDRRNAALELTTHGELAAVGLGTPQGVVSVLAASALARAYGVPAPVVRDALALFRA